MGCRKGWTKGVYTIEASILIPLLLFVMATGIKIGLSLYGEIVDAHEEEQVMEVWAVEDFYKSNWIREVLDEIH